MSAFGDLMAAFRARLLTVTDLPDIIAYENRTAAVVVGTPYVEEDYIGLTHEQYELGSTNTRQNGLYQVTLCWPLGAGILAPKNVTEAIASAFRSTLIVAGGRIVRILLVQEAAGVRDDPWWRVPVTITYLMDEN